MLMLDGTPLKPQTGAAIAADSLLGRRSVACEGAWAEVSIEEEGVAVCRS